jgi:aminoglycoside/choline kinase family phosphotransferase
VNELTFHVHLAIPHGGSPRLLAFTNRALPRVEPAEPDYTRPTELLEATRKLLHADVTVLRVLHGVYDPARHHSDALHLLEIHTPNWTPPEGMIWLSVDQLDLSHPELKTALEEWAVEIERGETPAQRPDWERAGWYADALMWVRQHIDFSAAHQRRTWTLSHMLQVETPDGDLYLKTVPAMFEREARLVAWLTQRYPAYIPALVAYDTDRRWMLMRDFGGTALAEVADAERWEAAVRRYGEIQRELSDHIDELAALGCADRRLNRLVERIDTIFADETFLLVGHRRGLTVEETAALRDAAAPLKEMGQTLEGYPIPYSLEHGDFHANNIRIVGDQTLYFDWTDGCIAHPFFDLGVLLDEFQDNVVVENLDQRLIDAYLSAWRDLASPHDLREAFRIARILGALHQAVSYYDIMAGLEASARWQLRGAGPYWLRVLLKHLAT